MVYSTFTITYCSTFQTFKYLFNGTLSLNFPIKSGNSGYKHFNFAAFPFSYSTRQKKGLGGNLDATRSHPLICG